MTALTEPLTERIQADRVPPPAAETEQASGHAVLTAIGAVFFAIGWIAGAIVSVLGFMAGAVRFGYRQGRLIIPPPPKAVPSQPVPAGSRA